MTRKEEKILMIIEFIIMIFIVLSTAGIEMANHKISEWKDAVILKQNNLNYVYLLTMNANGEYQYYSLVSIFRPDVSIEDYSELYKSNPYLNKDLLETYSKLKNKEISSAEFFNRVMDVNYHIYLKYLKIYNKEKDELNQFLNNRPQLKLSKLTIEWSLLERIFNLLRTIAIVIAALLYLTIYKTISNRTKK